MNALKIPRTIDRRASIAQFRLVERRAAKRPRGPRICGNRAPSPRALRRRSPPWAKWCGTGTGGVGLWRGVARGGAGTGGPRGAGAAGSGDAAAAWSSSARDGARAAGPQARRLGIATGGP